MNKAIIIGILGRDPEIRALPNGKRKCNMSVATSRKWTDKDSGEKKEKTEWHRVVIWNDVLCGVAEKWIAKGSKVAIEGEIQTRKWTDKDGAEKYSTEIVVEAFNGSLEIVSWPDDGKKADPHAEERAVAGGYVPTKAGGIDLDDEIPF